MSTLQPVQLRDVSRHDDDTREIAFELWSLACNRDAKAVHRRLALPPDQGGYGREVPYSTVAYWAREGRWAERADERFSELMPAIYAEMVANLVLAGLDATRRLRQAVNLEGMTAQEARATAEASKVALDRIGLDPQNVGETMGRYAKRAGRKLATVQDLMALDPDALAAWAGEAIGPDTDGTEG